MHKISRKQFIKHSVKGTLLMIPAASKILLQGYSKKEEHDLIIFEGVVYDGLRNPGRILKRNA